jgi:hypothetical protein
MERNQTNKQLKDEIITKGSVRLSISQMMLMCEWFIFTIFPPLTSSQPIVVELEGDIDEFDRFITPMNS